MGIISEDEEIPSNLDNGFDEHLIRKDVEEERRRQFDWQVKDQRDQQERRDRLRLQRVAASGKDSRLYSVDEIIWTCRGKGKGDEIQINFRELGFIEDMEGLHQAEKLIDEMAKDGCFAKNETYQGSANIVFNLSSPDDLKLKRFRSELASATGVATPTPSHAITPLKLPADTNWQDITIWFRDGHDVNIYIKQDVSAVIKSDFRKMGFEDKKQRKPNVQWKLLEIYGLLRKEGTDSIAWEDKTTDPKLKQKKKRLAKCLKEYFGIDEDPFYSYRKEKAYRIKFTVVPLDMTPNDVWAVTV